MQKSYPQPQRRGFVPFITRNRYITNHFGERWQFFYGDGVFNLKIGFYTAILAFKNKLKYKRTKQIFAYFYHIVLLECLICGAILVFEGIFVTDFSKVLKYLLCLPAQE